MSKFYPFCLNSRRWITVFFAMNLPKSCPHEIEKDCQDEGCSYHEWRQPSDYLLKRVEIMKSLDMDIIDSKEIK